MDRKLSKLRDMAGGVASCDPGNRQKFATGGTVGGGDMIGGDAPKPSLSRPGRSIGKPKAGSAKKGGTNVNVVIMPKADGAPKPPIDQPMAGPGGPLPIPGGPGPSMPMPPPGGPSPGAGGPPMPLRASGGRVKRAAGGKVKFTAGAESGVGRLQKAKSMKSKGD